MNYDVGRKRKKIDRFARRMANRHRAPSHDIYVTIRAVEPDVAPIAYLPDLTAPAPVPEA